VEAGQRLGSYTLQGLLGRGAMGEVWLADADHGGRAAVKVMLGSDPDSDAAKRFAREIQLLAALEHRGIVRALGGLEREGELLFYAMEPIMGRTLHALLRAGGPLEPTQAVALTCELLEALDAAHQAGVIHRDVKPSNVLVDRDGRARLTDFGLALAQDHTRLTAASTILGTLAYMSPEQAKGEQATAQSDLYAVGALLFELLAGRPPFEAETPSGLLMQHITMPAPPLGSLVEALPEGLAALVASALAKAPAERPASAAAFAEALRGMVPQVTAGFDMASTVELRERVEALDRASPADTEPPPTAATLVTPPAGASAVAVQPAAPSRGWVAWVVVLVLGLGVLVRPPWNTTPTPPPSPSTGPSPSPPSPVAASPRAIPSETQAGSAAEPAAARVTVELRDGSSVTGLLQTFDGQAGTLTLLAEPDGAVRTIDRAELRRITHVPAGEEGDARGDAPR
jgi:serine/threonine-protein kinase